MRYKLLKLGANGGDHRQLIFDGLGSLLSGYSVTLHSRLGIVDRRRGGLG
jgi:hypothetical protein